MAIDMVLNQVEVWENSFGWMSAENLRKPVLSYRTGSGELDSGHQASLSAPSTEEPSDCSQFHTHQHFLMKMTSFAVFQIFIC